MGRGYPTRDGWKDRQLVLKGTFEQHCCEERLALEALHDEQHWLDLFRE
jgi:hypothetical protein